MVTVTPLQEALTAVISQHKIHSPYKQISVPSSGADQRSILGDALISSDTEWSEDVLRATDQVWEGERSIEKNCGEWTDHRSIPNQIIYHGNHKGPIKSKSETSISVWRGDITRLQIDAIVNAANASGTGCYQPNHRCVDNIIHRRSGPRLRMACKKAMHKRSTPLQAGTPPIVTDAFHLPCRHVIHVTGPQVEPGKQPTLKDRRELESAYEKTLDAASLHGDIKSVAFCCISTGLFGYPQEEASMVAMATVRNWLDQHANSGIKAIVFDVYTENDEKIYNQSIRRIFSKKNASPIADTRQACIDVASTWIQQADAVLIVAGAGMSVKPNEMVYTNADDFAKHYPWFTRWGYRTAYETMGLFADHKVPETAKWAFWAKHMDNMRWAFTPNQGHHILKQIVDTKKEHFVLTSNVDACFERSGFDKNRIYTPQGEWTYTQCLKACRPSSVFETRPYLKNILPNISTDGRIPKELVPRCPNCGGPMFGNVRGGGWFLHHERYQRQNEALQRWMDALIQDEEHFKKVVVIEIGAGFNTPTVTRFPAESFVRELGNDRGRLIRINPTEAVVPSDLKALSIPEGWDALVDIHKAGGSADNCEDGVTPEEMERVVLDYHRRQGKSKGASYAQLKSYFGHFDWRRFLSQLRD